MSLSCSIFSLFFIINYEKKNGKLCDLSILFYKISNPIITFFPIFMKDSNIFHLHPDTVLNIYISDRFIIVHSISHDCANIAVTHLTIFTSTISLKHLDTDMRSAETSMCRARSHFHFSRMST